MQLVRAILFALLLGFSWAQSSTLFEYHTIVRIPHPHWVWG